MSTTYHHFSRFKAALKPVTATVLLLNASTASAQLPTLGDLLNSIITLNGQVSSLNVDVNILNNQTTTNTTAIAQLNYDYSVVTAQIAANGALVAALDGRLASVEGMLPPLAARTTALEAALATQASAVATNTSAIAANTAVGTANTAAIAANVLRDDAQDVSIAANANIGLSNSAAIAANGLRDDSQDVSIAANTSAIAANTSAIGTLDGRVDAHDVILAQHTTDIAAATQIATNAQTATSTLRGDVIAGRIGLVQQQTPTGTITVGAQTGGTEVSLAGTAGNRRVSGVADGVATSDAATVGQVAQSQAQAVTMANDYTDRSMANIAARYDDHTTSLIAANNTVIRREINAAAASTAAISSLPHSIVPGEGMGAVGIGGRGDSVAFAIGVSKAFRVENTPVVRAGAAIDARTGTLSYNAAVGVHF
ncbi:MAG: hypothetical protein ABI898_00420 [Sphingomonadales bacterium]